MNKTELTLNGQPYWSRAIHIFRTELEKERPCSYHGQDMVDTQHNA